MKNVLVIHPKDKSTDFLYPIYENLPNKTVVTGDITKDELIELIHLHDQVIMLGHGSPNGLMSVGQFLGQGPYIIDNSIVSALKHKNNNIFIWCNADKFVNKHDLNGLYSGMFISEVMEATYCGVLGVTQEQVNESNDEFADMLGSCLTQYNKGIKYSLHEVYHHIDDAYRMLAKTNPVAKYNCIRWYINWKGKADLVSLHR
jgi:hypothetical protein